MSESDNVRILQNRPVVWKVEYVTVIPKKTHPQVLEDLRNILCTMLASKMYKSYILDWLKGEVKL